MIKIYLKIILIWGTSLLMIVTGTIVYPQMGYDTIARFLLLASSTLLGIISYFLSRWETRKGAKLVFLNFVLLFGVFGMACPLYQLAMGLVFGSNLWADFYFYEYQNIVYSLVLFLCVSYLVADHIMRGRSTCTKYFATFTVVVGVWVVVFYPFLLDARYLDTVADYRNLKAVRQSIVSLQNEGNTNPSTEEIASRTHLTLSDMVPKDETIEQHKKRHIAELQNYASEQNGVLLFYRPLWLRCSLTSLLSVLLVLFCIGHQYFFDSPRGAYMEKIVWCLFLNCILEALHLFAYAKATRGGVFDGIVNAGAYLSIGVYWLMLLLAGLRLRFIQTIEGNYYERRLLIDPTHISRWRDAFDKWVLKQFMKPGELDRRFLIQRRSQKEQA